MTRARDVADTQDNVGGAVAPFVAGKNKIINGDFNINQRGFTSTTTSGVFGFDRWALISGGNGTSTMSAQTFAPGAAPVAGYEAINFLRVATTGQSTTNVYTFPIQRIEDVRTFAGQTVTVSFWAKAASGNPKVAVEIEQYFGTGGSPSATTANYFGQATLSTSWARYSVTGTLPSISGKTIGTNNNSNIQLNLWVSSGSDWNSRTGSLGIQTNTFDFWGVQVEAGSVATPFTTATGTIQGELAACQRYYFRFTGPDAYSTYGMGYYVGSTQGAVDLPHPVPLRTKAATIDFGNVAIQNASAAIAGINTLTINQGSLKGTSLEFTIASGGTLGQACRFLNNNNAAGYIGLGAEL